MTHTRAVTASSTVRKLSLAVCVSMAATSCSSRMQTTATSATAATPPAISLTPGSAAGTEPTVPAVTQASTTQASTTAPTSSSTSAASTVAASSAPATVAAATTASTTSLRAKEAQIRDAMTASLQPGFYTVATGTPADSFPNGASIGISVPGQPDLLIGVGDEANATSTPFDPGAPFKPGEVTVNVLFALYDLLVDDGTIAPGTKLSMWLPAYPNADRITAQMLRDGDYGGHGMAAVADWVSLVTSDWSKDWTLEEMLAESAKVAPGAIGTKGNGDTAATALAFMLEKATGKTFAQLMDERIAKPLGLADTSVLDPKHMPANFSHGRFNLGGTAHTTAEFPFDSFVTTGVAHGGLISTLPDQLTLVRALSTGGLPGFKRLPTPEKFPTDHLLSDSDGDRYVGQNFPLNLHCPCLTTPDGHTGTAIGRRANEPGSLTHWYYFPKTDVTIVIHNNSNEAGTPLEVQNLVYRIYTIVTGDAVR